MSYDIEDMERIIGNNIASRVVKQYMINKNNIDTYYDKKLMTNNN